MGIVLRQVVLGVAAAGLLAGCGSSRVTVESTAAAATKTHATVWLCFPGRKPNPCAVSLGTTAVRADGTRAVERVRAAAHPAIDCFYVYPTVSREPTGNADLRIGLEERLVAETQAAWFSQVCRVYAPMYRQITSAGLAGAGHPSPAEAYGDVRAAWRDYLVHDNHGRGVVLIGHSQGAYALKQLVKDEVDRVPATRRLLVSAILLGGNVLTGNPGDFANVPPCRSSAQTGCVVAYSSFDRKPPPNARFGIAANPAEHVVCVNPAAPAGGAAPVTPLFPSALLQLLGGGGLGVTPKTFWVAFPGLYTARCERSGNASWLQIDHRTRAGDRRPVVRALLGAGWGLHAVDVNIALADLVGLVRDEAAAYAKAR